MGESVVEGTIVKWTKKVGDNVAADETLLEISTDKVDSEIPAPASGIVAELLAAEGETVAVGAAIAVIDITAIDAAEISPTEEGKPAETVAAGINPAVGKDKSRRKITPLAKSVAAGENVREDVLTSIPGSGFQNRVLKADVLRYLQQDTPVTPAKKPAEQVLLKPEPEQPAVTFSGQIERVPMNHIRKSIAEHMVASARTSPHVTSIHEVDVSKIMAYTGRVQHSFHEREGVKLTLTSFIAQAAIGALKEFPFVNASIDGEEIVLHKEINLGIAVALENGLIVPVIRRAGEFNLIGLTKAIYDVAVRARNKKLLPDEVQGGTFSITNFGVFDTLIGTPIINQPQVAILGMGAAKQKPVVIDGMIATRWMMYLSLTYDHRLLDGAVGGRFLKRMTEMLERFEPESEN